MLAKGPEEELQHLNIEQLRIKVSAYCLIAKCYVIFVKQNWKIYISLLFQVLELQAVNSELQKKLLLMEKDIVGKDPVVSQKDQT